MFHKRELSYKNKFSYQYNIFLSFNKCHKKYEMRCALRFKIRISAREILASSLNTKALFQWKGKCWEKEKKKAAWRQTKKTRRNWQSKLSFNLRWRINLSNGECNRCPNGMLIRPELLNSRTSHVARNLRRQMLGRQLVVIADTAIWCEASEQDDAIINNCV